MVSIHGHMAPLQRPMVRQNIMAMGSDQSGSSEKEQACASGSPPLPLLLLQALSLSGGVTHK